MVESMAVESLAGRIVSELDSGRGRADVIAALAGEGLAEESASVLVHEIGDTLASKWGRHMVTGALWCGGGTLVTVLTYQAAANGGTYMVAWGAIVFGLVDFVRGLAGWSKFKR